MSNGARKASGARKAFRVALIIATFILLVAVFPELIDGWKHSLGK